MERVLCDVVHRIHSGVFCSFAAWLQNLINGLWCTRKSPYTALSKVGCILDQYGLKLKFLNFQ